MEELHFRRNGVNKCRNFMKTFMFLYNIFFLVVGVAACIAATWMIYGKTNLEQIVGPHDYIKLLYLLLGAAIFTIIISFLGCYGSTYEVRWMLYLYGIVLVVIFMVLLITSITALLEREKAVKLVKNKLISSIKLYNKTEIIKEAWDQVQLYFKCCGVDSYMSWNQNVPTSCCRHSENEKVPSCDVNDTDAIYQTGCYTVLAQFFSSHVLHISVTILVIGTIKVIGMCFAFALASAVKNQRMDLDL